jgi:hypothetical protein
MARVNDSRNGHKPEENGHERDCNINDNSVDYLGVSSGRRLNLFSYIMR